jgi:hypothetical protein
VCKAKGSTSVQQPWGIKTIHVCMWQVAVTIHVCVCVWQAASLPICMTDVDYWALASAVAGIMGWCKNLQEKPRLGWITGCNCKSGRTGTTCMLSIQVHMDLMTDPYLHTQYHMLDWLLFHCH